MKTKPYDFQEKTINTIIDNYETHGYSFAGILYNMGKGKTLTALTIAERLAGLGRISALMIVSPKSINATWIAQIERHGDFPSKPFRWLGEKANTQKYKNALMSALVDPFPIFVCGVEAFQTKNALLFQTVADFIKRNKVMVIMDESTFIKNSSAKRTSNLTELCKTAAFKVILAGILVSETILDAYSQFEWLKHRFWKEGSPFFFSRKYVVTHKIRVQDGMEREVPATMKDVRIMMEKVELAEDTARRTGRDVPYYIRQLRYDAEELQRKLEYAKELEKEVYEQIAPYTHYAEVTDDLPAKIEAEIVVEMSDMEERVYEDFKRDLLTILDNDEIISVTTKAALFAKARQITGGFVDKEHPIEKRSSKLKALLDELEDFDGPVVVVSSYVGPIQSISDALNEIAPTVAFWSGTTQEARDKALVDFQAGTVKYLVLNPAVAGFGIDGLQHVCSTMYMYDEPLSSLMKEQTVARLLRNGQKNPVLIKSMKAVKQNGQPTIDQRCIDLLNDKMDLIERFNNLSKQDLKSFF